VAAFLDGRLRWTAIAEVIEESMGRWPGTKAESLDVVLAEDAQARAVAERAVERRSQAA
jgi:1-deoxy-D-xylulose-5-phosphate reductoisomerase